MNLSLVNSLCYTFGWFWCVLFGVRGENMIALLGAAVLIFFQLYLTKKNSLFLYLQDALLSLFSLFLGFFLELIFIHTHLLDYRNSGNLFPPLWILSLYPLFSLVINHSLKPIKKNLLLSFAVGFLGAPLSYMAGKNLGGLIFPHSLLTTWVFLGTFWGLFLSFLTYISNKIEKAAAETLSDKNAVSAVQLLYDGDCPLCNKEICFLKKKNINKTVDFLDIASKDFSEIPHPKVDYTTAMQQIHAIDSQGNIMTGLSAFAVVYARCGLLLISTLLRISFVKYFLEPFYKLFAKNRLRITGRDKK